MTDTLAPPDLESAETYSDFLEQMEELGLLENLEDQLPPGFSAVYEIGRILARGNDGLGKQLAPMMTLAPALDAPAARACEAREVTFVERQHQVCARCLCRHEMKCVEHSARPETTSRTAVQGFQTHRLSDGDRRHEPTEGLDVGARSGWRNSLDER